jgi:hypothetical protein
MGDSVSLQWVRFSDVLEEDLSSSEDEGKDKTAVIKR